MRKILSVALMLSIILCSFQAVLLNVCATSGGTTGDCSWSFGSNTLKISGNGLTGDYELFYQEDIPWYSRMDEIEKVVIEDGVTHLGNCLFAYATNLKEVELADSVKTIGSNTFTGCTSLKQFTVSKGVEYIDGFAFSNCTSMLEYFVEEGNEYFSVQEGVLFNKDKTSLYNYPIGITSDTYTIPDSVTVIMPYAFSYAVNLKTVNFSHKIVEIGDEAFKCCSSLKSIELYEGLKWLGGGVFQACSSLENITLPDGIEHIGGSAFERTAWYYDLSNWESSLLYYENYLLSGIYNYVDEENDIYDYKTVEGDVYIKEGTVLIAAEAMFFCDIKSVYIPDTVKYIGYSAFCYSALEGADVTNALVIEDDVFSNCDKFTYLNLNSGIEYIGGNIVAETPYLQNTNNYTDGILYNNGYILGYNSSIEKDVVIKDGTVLIAGNAFEEAPVSSIEFPSSLKRIGKEAFINCGYLKTLFIPKTVEIIDEYAYGYLKTYDFETEEYCYNVKTEAYALIKGYKNTAAHKYATEYGVAFEALAEEIKYYENNYTYTVSNGEAVIIGFNNTVDGDITVPPILGGYTVTGIGDSAFSGCGLISSVTIPYTVTSIGSSAFDGCNSLKNIYYNGSKSKFEAINVAENNEILTSVAVTCISVGDVYYDGVINANDLTALKKHLLSNGYNLFADLNENGKIDVLDLIRLKKNIS